MNVHEAVAAGNIPALIPLLAMYTGDEKWLRAPYAPARQKGLDDNHDGGLPPEIQAEIRAAAAEAIAADDSRCQARRTTSSCGCSASPWARRCRPEYGPMIALRARPARAADGRPMDGARGLPG